MTIIIHILFISFKKGSTYKPQYSDFTCFTLVSVLATFTPLPSTIHKADKKGRVRVTGIFIVCKHNASILLGRVTYFVMCICGNSGNTLNTFLNGEFHRVFSKVPTFKFMRVI